MRADALTVIPLRARTIIALAEVANGFKDYSITMRRFVWIALFTLALTLGPFGSGAHGALLPVQSDCCETVCPDMAGCATLQLCQTCTSPTALMPKQLAVNHLERPPFAHPGNELALVGPAPKVWTPPD